MIAISKIFVLVGASGSGKSTLGKSLNIPRIITHTTRKKRIGEKDGKHYYFVNKKEFKQLDFVENTKYNGNLYGAAKTEIEDKLDKYNKVYTVMDSLGVKNLRRLYPNKVVVIYINVKRKESIQRMIDRGDDEFVIAERVSNANKKGEFNNYDIADYVINNFDGMLDKSKKLINYIVNELEG